MDFQTIYADVFSRGFNFLDDAGAGLARVKRRINERYADIAERADWPFLYTDASGTAPLTISALREVLSVTDSTNDTILQHVDRRTLNEWFPDLPSTGAPTYWYLDSENVIAVYPANTTITVKVRYLKTVTDLSGATDATLLPDRFEWLIVEGAVADLHRDNGDDTEAALSEQRYEEGIARMIESFAFRENAPDFVVTTGASIDW